MDPHWSLWLESEKPKEAVIVTYVICCHPGRCPLYPLVALSLCLLIEIAVIPPPRVIPSKV